METFKENMKYMKGGKNDDEANKKQDKILASIFNFEREFSEGRRRKDSCFGVSRMKNFMKSSAIFPSIEF